MSVCLCRSRLANLVRALTKLELESGRPRALRQDMPQDLRIAALLGEDCNRESLVCRRDSADPTLVFMLKKTQPVCESQHLEQVGSRASNHALSLQVHVQLLFPRVARPGIDGCHLSRCVDQDPQSHCTEPCAEPAKIARVSIGLTWSAPKLLTLSLHFHDSTSQVGRRTIFIRELVGAHTCSQNLGAGYWFQKLAGAAYIPRTS